MSKRQSQFFLYIPQHSWTLSKARDRTKQLLKGASKSVPKFPSLPSELLMPNDNAMALHANHKFVAIADANENEMTFSSLRLEKKGGGKVGNQNLDVLVLSYSYHEIRIFEVLRALICVFLRIFS